MLTACANPKSEAWAPTAHKFRQALPSSPQPSERLHLQYGPIDLLIDVDGTERDVQQAHRAAMASFDGLLESLVDELTLLKQPVTALGSPPKGVVALSMWQACLPHADQFVTAMAAVAGAVADHVLSGIVTTVPSVNRVWVNNGGDIAFRLSEGTTTQLAVCTNEAKESARVLIASGDGVGGVATSGWTGRSHSLGIADAVTVLAPTAAAADVAATLIANAVQLPNQELDKHYVQRMPAVDLQPDSDLGHALVTTAVAQLPIQQCDAALQCGLVAAKKIMKKTTLQGVFIDCQGQRVSIGECV